MKKEKSFTRSETNNRYKPESRPKTEQENAYISKNDSSGGNNNDNLINSSHDSYKPSRKTDQEKNQKSHKIGNSKNYDINDNVINSSHHSYKPTRNTDQEKDQRSYKNGNSNNYDNLDNLSHDSYKPSRKIDQENDQRSYKNGTGKNLAKNYDSIEEQNNNYDHNDNYHDNSRRKNNKSNISNNPSNNYNYVSESPYSHQNLKDDPKKGKNSEQIMQAMQQLTRKVSSLEHAIERVTSPTRSTPQDLNSTKGSHNRWKSTDKVKHSRVSELAVKSPCSKDHHLHH